MSVEKTESIMKSVALSLVGKIQDAYIEYGPDFILVDKGQGKEYDITYSESTDAFSITKPDQTVTKLSNRADVVGFIRVQ